MREKDKLIDEQKDKIKKLEEQVADLEKERKQLTDDLVDAKNKLSSSEADRKALEADKKASEKYTSELEDKITRMRDYMAMGADPVVAGRTVGLLPGDVAPIPTPASAHTPAGTPTIAEVMAMVVASVPKGAEGLFDDKINNVKQALLELAQAQLCLKV